MASIVALVLLASAAVPVLALPGAVLTTTVAPEEGISPRSGVASICNGYNLGIGQAQKDPDGNSSWYTYDNYCNRIDTVQYTPSQSPCGGGQFGCTQGPDVTFDSYVRVDGAQDHYICTPDPKTENCNSDTVSVCCSLQTVCDDPTQPNAACYGLLDIDSYILDWWNENSEACGSEFANCWYSKKTIYAPSTCDQLNTDPACEQPKWNDFKNTGGSAVADFYVTWLIWNTQGFFLDLYNAIGGAEATITESLGAVVEVLDPPGDKLAKGLDYALYALTFGLAMFAEGSLLAAAFLRTASQSTLLMSKLYPTGTVDSRWQTWADVSEEIVKLTSKYQTSISSALPDIQNNITLFRTFNGEAGLAGVRPSLDGLETSLAASLSTFATASTLNQLSIVASRGMNTDVNALQTNGSNLMWHTGCGTGYDSAGICAEWYYDGTDSYSLTDPLHQSTSFNKQLEALIGGTNPPTSGKLLFTGALACNPHDGTAAPTVDPVNPTQISCLSNLRICTWTMYDQGPYSDCPNLPDKNAALPNFGGGCVGTFGTSLISVPPAYLGGGILLHGFNGEGFWSSEQACKD